MLRRHVALFARLPINPSAQTWATRPTQWTAPRVVQRRRYATAQKVILRDYQLDCIQAVLAALENGHKRVGISLATGGGKTVIFTRLIEHIKPEAPEATRTLILAHRRELVEQAARHCVEAYPDKTVEIDMGKMQASGLADITVATVPSLQKNERLSKYDPTLYKLVLVDEAHHIVAGGYMKILRHFGLDRKNHTSPTLVGVSATFSRPDGIALGAAIDEIVYHKDYVDLMEGDYLSGVLFTTVQSSANLSGVKKSSKTGDFLTPELSNAVNTPEVNEVTVRSWLASAAGRKSTLVFCVDLAHVADLTQTFRRHGFDARFVTGDTPTKERTETLAAFKKREFPVLLNCGVFTEGTDIPSIDCVLLARPTRSRNLLIQMIGRGMRKFTGKENCHVIDMVSSLADGIVTAPTLLGLDPDTLLEAASVEDMKSVREKQEAEKQRVATAYSTTSSSPDDRASSPVKVTFTNYDSVYDLISDTSGERHIRSLSFNAWVQVGQDRYVLSDNRGNYLRIQRATDTAPQPSTPSSSSTSSPSLPQPPLFRVLSIRTLPPTLQTRTKSPFATPTTLLLAPTLSAAVQGADSFASKTYPRALILKKSAWRDTPPSEGQLKFLNKLRARDTPLVEGDLNKGMAADMIVKLKHGAKGEFARMRVVERKVRREEVVLGREERVRRAGGVGVGPVPV